MMEVGLVVEPGDVDKILHASLSLSLSISLSPDKIMHAYADPRSISLTHKNTHSLSLFLSLSLSRSLDLSRSLSFSLALSRYDPACVRRPQVD